MKSNKKKYSEADFSKRRDELFQLAGEISDLSGYKMAVVVLSSDNKPYTCGNPAVDCALDHFLGEEDSRDALDEVREGDDDDDEDALEAEGEVHDRVTVEKLKALLDEPNVEAMGLHELIKYKALLEGFQKNMHSSKMKRRKRRIN